MNNENEIIGWGETFIAEESSFKLFQPGNYAFVVTGFERKIYDGNSDKIQNGTPFAEITMEFSGPEGTTLTSDRLYMTKKWQWKLTQFFTGIGQAPVLGQPFSPNWNNVIGSRGTAKLRINKFTKKDGSPGENNQIEEYLKPTANDGTISQTAAQTGQQTQNSFQPGAF